MDEQIIDAYYQAIVENQFNFKSPGYLKNFTNGERDWKTLTGQWFTSTSLENHLLDKEVWGLSGGIPKNTDYILSRYIIADIDNHKDNKESLSLEERYSYACDLFESEGVVFQSSCSGGLHVYFPTEPLINENQLHHIRSYINDNLGTNQIEIYPSRKVLRLPLGFESYVFHWHDFSQPISYDKERNIEIMLEYFTRSERVSVSAVMSKIKAYTKKTTYHLTKNHSNHNQSDWVSEGEYLYNHGLQSPNTRNESLLKVNTFLLTNGHVKDERKQIMYDWIRTKHNGLSNDVNNGKMRQIEREIHSIAFSSKGCERISQRLKEINSRSPEYRKAQQVTKSVADNIYDKYQISRRIYTKFLAGMILLSKLNKSAEIPVSVDMLRKVSRYSYKCLRCAKQLRHLQTVSPSDYLSGKCTIYRLCKSLLVREVQQCSKVS